LNRLKFTAVIHNHQPVGNFDKVFQRITDSCYRPFLESLKKYPSFHFSLHISGPLLRWWEKNDTGLVDLVGEMVSSGQTELLMGGFYEPVLASLSPADRRGQVSMMREYLRDRFGVAPDGLWLTERVWENGMTEDLIAEEVEYVLVDDRHFKINGFSDEELRGYFLTESDGRPLAVFPIDEKLRYMIPFRPVDDLMAYLRETWEKGGSLIVYGDDGEKMGGWPGTAGWVYKEGWLSRFLEGMMALQDEFLEIKTCSQILEEEKPSGLCYLPSASYTEMEGWALPAENLVEMTELTDHLGDDFERYKPFVRGGHWKNFLVKYPESNLLHKKVMHLSRVLRRRRIVPPKILEDLFASQCNDTYWHGVFGGLYLPHLRAAVWERVSRLEKYLRMGEDLTLEPLDIDLDGRQEILVHSYQFSAILRPEKGGCVSEYSYFPQGNNYCNVLSRRFEAYHKDFFEKKGNGDKSCKDEGTTSIHDLPRELPDSACGDLVYDNSQRGLFVDRFFEKTGGVRKYKKSGLTEFGNFSYGDYHWKLVKDGILMEREEEVMFGEQEGKLSVKKELTFSPDGEMELKTAVNFHDNPFGLRYGVELSLSPPFLFKGYGIMKVDNMDISTGSGPSTFENAQSILFGEEDSQLALLVEWTPTADLWYYPIHTISQSETRFEKTLQGLTVFPNWHLPSGLADTTSIILKWRFVEP
jgi:alpha-amylase/alpha-mannosidase (GH57 family)